MAPPLARPSSIARVLRINELETIEDGVLSVLYLHPGIITPERIRAFGPGAWQEVIRSK
ncbi:protein of unknown function [Agreia sp. COWG]|nr:protein of unknown function [Agreia sp. COWG]